jgi:uncharacterized membrane protein YeaQ/YmgE (transglycosylase-associated protein family)
MNIVIGLLVGGLLGWAASFVSGTSARPGMRLNIVAGIVGVALGGWLLSELLGSSPFDQSEFSVAELLVSSLGAMVVLAVVQLLGSITGRRARTAPKRDLITYSRFLYRDPLTK